MLFRSPVPPATLRILANATVAPIAEERRQADIAAGIDGATSPPTAAQNAGA